MSSQLQPSSGSRYFLLAIIAGLVGISFVSIQWIEFASENADIPFSRIPKRSLLAAAAGPDPSLIGYWKFDEGIGFAAADASGNNNNGTLINGPTWTQGKVNGALSFDGVNDYVSIPDSASLSSIAQLSFSAWVNQSSLATAKGIASQTGSSGSDQSWAIQTGSSDSTTLRVTLGTGGTGFGSTPAQSWSTGWHHVAFVYDGFQTGNANRLKVYIDGVEQSLTFNGTIPSMLQNSTRPIRIGDSYQLLRIWNGLIDEVKLYSRALTSQEVQSLVSVIIPPPPPPPTPQPTVSFSANPNLITSGQSTALTWSSTNSISCSASGAWSGVKAISGTQSVAPVQTTTYILTCTGSGGSISQTVAVNVVAASSGSREIFLKVKTGVIANQAFFDQLRVRLKRSYYADRKFKGKILDAARAQGLDRLFLAESLPGVDPTQLIRDLQANPAFEYVDPSTFFAPQDIIPNDPQFPLQWNLKNTGQAGGSQSAGTLGADIKAYKAWDIATTTDIVVAVIDSGIDFNNPDLAPVIWTNLGEIPNNNIDDDDNGYVDDVHGWDFSSCAQVQNNADNTQTCLAPKARDNMPEDRHGHGTQIAGIIGAVGNNGVGIAGINWKVKVVPIKHGYEYYGLTSDKIDGLIYAVQLGIKITSNSWGSYSGNSKAIYDVVSFAEKAGQLFVASAGNFQRNIDINPVFPPSLDLPNIISVAATNNRDQLASFSDFGPISVDLAAPGVQVPTTKLGGGYIYVDGTSHATPHVAAAAALFWGKNPQLTYAQVKEKILSSVDVIPSLVGKIATGGRLNLEKLMKSGVVSPPPPPPQPTVSFSANPSSISSGQSATLTWSSTNASSCSASGAWSGVKAISGTQSVAPVQTTTYILTCTGSGGSDSKSMIVTVTAPPPPPLPPPPISLDTLKAGEWLEIPNSHLADCCLPTSKPPGSSGYGSIMGAWSGGAYDTKRDRLIVWGGGHGDYAGNELYAFDLNTQKWSRVWGPTPNNFIPYPPPTPSETYLNGDPASRHTYDGLEYLPNIDRFWSHSGSLWSGSGGFGPGTWMFDFANSRWERKADIPDPAASYGRTAYDPTTGHVFVQKYTRFYEYDPQGGSWTQRGNFPSGLDETVGTIDSKRRRFIILGSSKAQFYDLTVSGIQTLKDLPTTGATEIQGGKFIGVDYDPVSDQLVAWQGGADVYTLNLDTLVWSRRAPAGSNTVIPSQPASSGTFGRFRYVPSKNVFVLVNSINQDVLVYKLSGASGTPVPAPAPTLTFSASPASITAGQSATLTWSSANATACTASGGWTGSKALNGSQSITPSVTTIYTLTCTGAGGSVPQSVTVTVIPSSPSTPPDPDPIDQFSQNFGNVYYIQFTKPLDDAAFAEYVRYVSYYPLKGTVPLEAWIFSGGGGAIPCYPGKPCSNNPSPFSAFPTVWFTLDGQRISAAISSPPYQTTLDTTKFADGSHALGLEVRSNEGTRFIPLGLAVTIDNVFGPVVGAQRMAVCSNKFFFRIGSDDTGECDWVTITGSAMSGSGSPNTTPRQAIPFASIPQAVDLWAEQIEPNEIIQPHLEQMPGGHLAATYKMKYFYYNINDRGIALIDGPRGIGFSGTIVGGYVDKNGDLVALAPSGRVMRITPRGDITTLAGFRVRSGQLPPYWDAEADFGSSGKQFFESFYETIGNFVDGPGNFVGARDVIADPRDASGRTLFVADALNHRVAKVDLSTTPVTISTYAGSLVRQAGYQDGNATGALFNEPWNLAMDGVGNIYVSDRLNHAIRKIAPDRKVTTLFRSTIIPPLSGTDGGKPSRPSGLTLDQARAQYMKDGVFAQATLIYPEALKFDSLGRLVVGESMIMALRKIDISSQRIDFIASVPQPTSANQNDVNIAIDDKGTCGPRDDMFVSTWAGRWRVSATGTEGRIATTNVSAFNPHTRQGRVATTDLSGYSNFTACGGGALWLKGGIDGLSRLTLARSTDSTMSLSDAQRYAAGKQIYEYGTVPNFPGRSSFILLHGAGGFSQFGLPSFDSVASMSDAALASQIQAGWGSAAGARPEITGEDLDNLIYFIRWNCLACLNAGTLRPASLPLDQTAPVVSNVTVTAVAEGSVKVSWQTNESTIGFVSFGKNTNYGNFSSIENGFGAQHELIISDLATNTPYHFRVRTKDMAGNQASGVDVLFTPADTTLPPPTPQPTLLFSANPLAINPGGSSLLIWSSTDTSFCNASGGWSGTKALFGSQSVTPSVTTTYTLSCTGTGGNISQSVTITVSTSLPPPPPAPPPPSGAKGNTYYLDFTKPLSSSAFQRYARYLFSFVLKGRAPIEMWLFTSGGGQVPCYPGRKDCAGIHTLAEFPTVWITVDGERVSQALTGPPYALDLDTTRFDDGSHMLSADVMSNDGSIIKVVPLSVTFDNIPGPVVGPQRIANCATKHGMEFGDIDGFCDWLLYPGAGAQPLAAPISTPRTAIPYSSVVKGSDLWVENVVPPGGFTSRFLEAPGGHITTNGRQLYFYSDLNEHIVPQIDGERNQATLGHPVAAYVNYNANLILTLTDGRIVDVSPQGKVETIAGWRVKSGVTAPYWDSRNFNRFGKDGKTFFDSRYEAVGNFVDGPNFLYEPWDAIPDPRDNEIIYVADSLHHRIVKVNRHTRPATVSTYAGSLTGQAGYRDGIGSGALFREPWNIAIAPDGTMFVSDRLNHAIRKITPDRTVTTLFRSTVLPDVSGINTNDRQPPTEGKTVDQRRASYMKNGAFDQATLIYPEGLRFDSSGRLVVAENLIMAIRKIDLQSGRIDFFSSAPRPSDFTSRNIDISMDDGTCGPRDDILVATFAQGGPWRISADGSQTTVLAPLTDGTVDYAHGRANYLLNIGYPWFAACGKGAIWMGGVSEGLYRLTLAKPSDPILDVKAYKAGRTVYGLGTVPGFPSRPSFSLLHGTKGSDHFGGKTFDHLFSMSDAEITQLIQSGWGSRSGPRPEITGKDLANLLYYIRWESLPSLNAGILPLPPVQNDSSSPLINGIAATAIGANSAKITWSTNESAIGFVAFGKNVLYGNSSIVESGFGTEHSVTIADLAPQTTYHVEVHAKDIAGNHAIASDFEFRTTGSAALLPGITLDAKPAIVSAGGAATILWSVTNATQCLASGGWSGSKTPTSGTEVISNITQNKSFILVCSNVNGSASKSTSVVVVQQAVPVLLVNKTSIDFGRQVFNAESPAENVTLSNSGGAPLAISQIMVSGDFQETQELSCALTLEPGESCTLEISFLPTALGVRTGTLSIQHNAQGSPATVSLVGSGIPISKKFGLGDRIVTNSIVNVRATPSLTGSQLGSQASGAAGAIVDGPTFMDGLHWWRINFDTGVDGWVAEDSLTKTASAPPPTPAPSVTFTVTPISLSAGQSAALNWSSSNATACTASGAWSGTRSITGSVSTGPVFQTSIFTLTCTGNGGITSKSATVTVLGAASIKTVASGNWSDARIWQGARVPSANEDVVIDGAFTVTYDVPYNANPAAEARTITIKNGGTLKFSRAISTRLDLNGSLMVLDGGRLDAGKAGDPITQGLQTYIGFNITNDRSFKGGAVAGSDPALHDFLPEDIGLWVVGANARADFYGAATPRTWTKLVVDAPAGSSALALRDTPQGWRIGDKIVISPTGSNPDETEVRTITALTGAKITVDRPFEFLHEGNLKAYHKTTQIIRTMASASALGADEVLLAAQAEVGLLSHNVIIASNGVKDGDSHHRAHVMFVHGAKGSVYYTEFRDLGPRGILGRYPLHLHKLGDAGSGFVINGVSVWSSIADPMSKCITIHTTNGATVSNVVGFNAQGACFYVEDAEESGNVLENNLGVRVHAPEELPNTPVVTRFGYDPTASAIFWVREKNTYRGNVAAGGRAKVAGFWLTPSRLSLSVPTLFEANEAHANAFGLEYSGGQELTMTADKTFVWRNGVGLEATNPVGAITKESVLWANTVPVSTPQPGQIISATIVAPAVSPPPAPAVAVTLTAFPTSISAGQSSTLSWVATSSTVCAASGGWSGVKAISGTESTGPLSSSKTYTLTCTGSQGSITRSLSVTVGGLPPPPSPTSQPTLSFSTNPSNISQGEYSTLTWASSNANFCTASGAWLGSKILSGFQRVGPLVTTQNYTLACTGSGGSISKSATVTVSQGPVVVPPPTPTSTPPVLPPSAGSGSDIRPPRAIGDLALLKRTSRTLRLTWKSPIDEDSGRASTYEVKYLENDSSLQSKWESAPAITNTMTPRVAGDPETLSLSSLKPNTTYIFGIRSRDLRQNRSDFSNSLTVRTKQIPPKPQIQQVSFSSAILSWTTPAYQDGTLIYQVMRSATPFTTLTDPDVQIVGTTTQTTFTDTATQPNTTYYYAIASFVDPGEYSDLEFVTITTPTVGSAPAMATLSLGGASTLTPGSYFTGIFTATSTATATSLITPASTPAGTRFLVPPFTRDLVFGMRREDVKNLQQVLVYEGFLTPNRVTGYYWNNTRSAVRRFQVKYGILPQNTPLTLRAYGRTGPQTRTKLNELYTDDQDRQARIRVLQQQLLQLQVLLLQMQIQQAQRR